MAVEIVEQTTGITAKHLKKSFKDKLVIKDISLKCDKGEIVGLLGPNGAGKTTCFYMLSGLIKPDAGHIYLDESDITHSPLFMRARKGIGYLPQESSIFRGLTAEQNIEAVLEISEPDKNKREDRLNELIDEFNIGHVRDTAAIALSGGERRRVEIARALAMRPQFIMLDEPLAGVDPVAVSEIRELIHHLKNKNVGILITDHNVRETLGLVDRAYIIHEGHVLMEGTPDEIVQNDVVRKVYLGEGFKL